MVILETPTKKDSRKIRSMGRTIETHQHGEIIKAINHIGGL